MIFDCAAVIAVVSGAFVAATQSFAACSAAASARAIASLSSWDRNARYPPTPAPAAKASSAAQMPATQPRTETRWPPTVPDRFVGWLWRLKFGGLFGLVFCRYC